jgi:type II secretory pathway pseudopilin PulG
MIVIMIIGILVALSVSRFIEVKDHSLVAAASYDLDGVRKFLAYYSTDYGVFPAAAANYDDLKQQMMDPHGRPYGALPLSNTYTWLSYNLDAQGEYVLRVQVQDHMHTRLIATPDGVRRE